MRGPQRCERITWRRAASVLVCLAAWLPASPAGGQAIDLIDSPMYRLPKVPMQKVVEVFPKETLALWKRALERPEAEMRMRAAEAITRAQQRNVEGLQTTVAPLLAALDLPDQHPNVRVAVAQALIALKAEKAAPSLLRQSEAAGGDLRELVDPALAAWDYKPARAVWLERLRTPATPHRALVLAIQALGAVKEPQAAERLRELVLNSRVAPPVRLEAARALGQVRLSGQEKDAAKLAADPSPRGLVGRLAAAALLGHHEGAAAIQLLQRLADDTSPAVAAPALTRLLEIDPRLLVPSLQRYLNSRDAVVRGLAVQAMRRQPSLEHIKLLAARLRDEHLDVRNRAREALLELGHKKYRAPVIAAATPVLASGNWQGLEQAALLLTQLDHKPAASRLVELLRDERPEVFLAAAWGLRKLAVKDTLDGAQRYVKDKIAVLRAQAVPTRLSIMQDHQLSQLNQFLGQERYKPADPVLRQYVPRQPAWPESRAAAIWALSLIHEGAKDPALVKQLEERMTDFGPPPEVTSVRWMCAVAFARMKATEAVPTLQRFCRGYRVTREVVNNASGWALEQLTGERLPPVEPELHDMRDWFLVPSNRGKS
jgi:HEAT repeat protein